MGSNLFCTMPPALLKNIVAKHGNSGFEQTEHLISMIQKPFHLYCRNKEFRSRFSKGRSSSFGIAGIKVMKQLFGGEIN